jgi:hypothetical protein
MAWGNRDTKDNVVLTGIDAALLENYRLRDGATYAQIVGMAETMLGGFNAGMASDPFWSLLVSYTDQVETRYAIGNTGTMVAHSRVWPPRPGAGRAGRAYAPLPQVGSHAGLDGRLSGRGPAERHRGRLAHGPGRRSQPLAHERCLQRLLEARRRIRQHQRPERHRPVRPALRRPPPRPG